MIKHSLVYKGSWTFAVRKDFILDPNYSIGEKIVYQAIRSFCSADNSTAFPSVELLANALDVSRDTIYKHLAGLESKGLIMREQAKEEGRFSHTVYTVYDTEKPSQCGVLTHGEIPDSGNTDTNSTVPLVREYKPSLNKPSEIIPNPSIPNPIEKRMSFQDRGKQILNAMFSRPEKSAWTYYEESELLSLCRRDGFLIELYKVLELRNKMSIKNELKYFPQSLSSLLSKWSEILDKSNNYDSLTKPQSSRLNYAP